MKKTNLFAILALGAVPALLQAQTTNYSDVVGYQTLSIKGNPSGGSYFNFVPVQLSKAAVFTGSANATGTTVNLTGASLADVTSLPHYLIIKNGLGVGLVSDIVSSTSTSVTTADDLSASIPANTSVSIVPHVLLTDVLGSASNLVVQGGTADTADLVYLVALDGSFKPYYFKNSGFGQGWKNASTGATENTVPVYPSESILVERKAPTDVSALTQVGTVASTDMKLVYNTGFTSSASGFPSALNLSSLTTVVQGGTADTADLVYLIDSSTGQLSPFYYKNVGFGQGWKDASSGATVDGNTINIGSGFIVERKQPSSVTLSQNRPY